MREPLRVRVADERHAVSLARSLSGLDGLDVRRDGDGREVAVGGVDSDRTVAAVLDAIRDTLAGEPASFAHVLLDGREYHMQGE